ncbi:MAG: XylR family transcriptional regulator, partial [Planctomycetota bacterium]
MQNIPKIALLLSTTRKFSRDLIRGIIQYSKIHGPWKFYREPPDYIHLDVKKRFTRLKKWCPNGIITQDTTILEKILSMGMPTIIASDEKEITADIPKIITNNYEIGKMAAKHLLERGFCYFAYFGFTDTLWSMERYKGFSEEIRQAGSKTHLCKNLEHVKHLPWEKMQDTLTKWLKSLPKPIGIMACAGEFALNITEACKAPKLCIPEEVALITTDNDELIYELSHPPITSISYDTSRAGYEAAELLDKMIVGNKITNQTILVEPTYVETRLSTDILAIEDQEVAKAIHFIRTNSKKNINVNNVLDHVILSRCELNKRFRKYISRTVHEEITRIRINEIIFMLLNTNLSISQIALKLNFPYNKNISRYFQKQTGMSPQAYRAKHS